MLPRKTILISAVLTAFVLSMLGGVAMALKQPAAAPVAEATTVTTLSAQEAAAVAATVLNQQDIYSVESTSVNGVGAYEVVFSSGQVAVVGLDGQILSITQIQPVVVAQNNIAPASAPLGFAPAPAPAHSGDEHEGGGNDD
jgi:hypothetical protein